MACQGFIDNCTAALNGIMKDTKKHPFKSGYYVSTFLVSNETWEVLHKGKRIPESHVGVYGVRNYTSKDVK